MATEDVRIEKGHIIVDRVQGNDSIDVALSDVESVSYTRGAMGGTGALVLHTKDEDLLIRVETEDAGSVLKKVMPKSTKDTGGSELAPAPSGKGSPDSKEAPANS